MINIWNKLKELAKGIESDRDIEGIISFLQSYPNCKVVWIREKGVRLEPIKDKKEWGEIRKEVLLPVKEDIIKLFNKAHIQMLKEVRQLELEVKVNNVA